MSKPKAPTLPPTPSYYEDPYYQEGMSDLSRIGGQLTSLDFSGELAGLAPTVELNPDVLSTYFAGLQPYATSMRKQTIADLAANNQLESSVTANRLGQIDTDVMNLMLGKTSDLLTQNMQNRINLFGTGLNTTSGMTGYAQMNQSQRNEFNLKNYENQVEKAIFEQEASRGGLAGALTGGAGGALTGAVIGSMILPGVGTAIGAGIGGLAGGLGGGLSYTNTGSQLLNTGASAAGTYLGSGGSFKPKAPYIPGSSASNTPFIDPSTYRLTGQYNPFASPLG